MTRIGSVTAWLVGVLLLLAAASAQAQQKPSVLLYDGNNASGAYIQVEGDVKSLANTGFDDRASSIFVVRGNWQLCTRTNYEGDCKSFGQGLHELGTLSDKVSSLRPVETSSGTADDAHAVVLFLDRNGGGKSLRTTANISNLSNHAGFADAVSSIAIFRGTWEFCNKTSYKGTCITLGPGVYNLDNMNDSIDSLRRK